MFAGWFSVGAWFALFTVIVRLFWLFNVASAAWTVAAAVPASENPGARWMLPVVALVVVTVRYVGPETLVKVRASPSGSVPVMTWSAEIGRASCRERV